MWSRLSLLTVFVDAKLDDQLMLEGQVLQDIEILLLFYSYFK